MGLPWAHTASGRWETEPCLLRGVPAPSTGQWTCTASPGSCEKERDRDREHKREKRKMSGHHTITSSTQQFSSFEPFCSHTGHYHDPAFRRKHKTSFFIYVAFLLHKIRVVETAMCNVMFCIYKESRPFIKSSLNSVKNITRSQKCTAVLQVFSHRWTTKAHRKPRLSPPEGFPHILFVENNTHKSCISSSPEAGVNTSSSPITWFEEETRTLNVQVS